MRTGVKTILVVEDDPSIRRLVQWTLEDEGLAVDVATDGAEAIRYLADHRPALVVLDVMMPRADGYQVAAVLRSRRRRETPILFLTAAGEAPEAARRLGAEGFLAKPFELAELVALVHGLLDRSHLRLVSSREDELYTDTAAGG